VSGYFAPFVCFRFAPLHHVELVLYLFTSNTPSIPNVVLPAARARPTKQACRETLPLSSQPISSLFAAAGQLDRQTTDNDQSLFIYF